MFIIQHVTEGCLYTPAEIRVLCTPDSIKEMNSFHVMETEDLYPVFKLWQRCRKAKGFLFVQSNSWKLRSEIASPGSVACLKNIPQDLL